MSKETLLEAYRLIQQLERRLKESQQASREPVAVVGMACRFPGARTPEQFYGLLSDGRDAVAEVPRDRWDIDQHYDPEPGTLGKMYTRRGCFLDRVDQFDADFFQIAPREALMMDPQQRLLLEVSWQALEDAGLAGRRDSSIGVFMGLMHLEYGPLASRTRDDGYFDVHSGTGCEMSVIAGRLSHFLQLNGPSLVVGTACSSSLVAVHLACQSLRLRECRAALAGGVSLMLMPDMTSILCRMRALARDGRTKAFDDAADGYGRGEGCGVVVLKRLSDAQADGDRILAILPGSAINHDGPSGGLTVPSSSAQELVIRQALERAEVQPAEVNYVEAHGTGTSLGDPIELAALARIFAPRQTPDPLWIGSVKANVGHLEAAAGMASLIKVVMCLRQESLLQQVHFSQPNHRIPWQEIPIEVLRENRPWPAGKSRRLAGISSFGLSGINAHLLVEEAPLRQRSVPAIERPRHLLTLSARNPVLLKHLAENLESHLKAHPDESVSDVCFTLNSGRAQWDHRWTACVSSREELLTALAGLAPPASRTPTAPPKIGFVFASLNGDPPQPWLAQDPAYQAVMQEAGAVVSPTDTAAGSVIFRQVARLLAVARVWQGWGIVPATVVGVGEAGALAALCFRGVLTLESAWKRLCGGEMGAIPAGAAGCLQADGTRSAEEQLKAHGIKVVWDVGRSEGDIFELITDYLRQGGQVDWQQFDRPFSRQRLSLPTYPFARDSYWLKTAQPQDEFFGEQRPTHPLLGRQLRSPAIRGTLYESRLLSHFPAYLADHRVRQQVLMPAAAMLEWISLAAANQIGQRQAVEELEIRSPLVLGSRPVTAQLLIDDEQRLKIVSQADGDQSSEWVEHAVGRLTGLQPADEREALSGIQARCGFEVPIAEAYRRLEKLGLEYGSRFRGLRTLRRNSSEAVGHAELPEELQTELADYPIHPALLDACLQTAMAWSDEQTALLIPVSFGRFQWWSGSAPSDVWCHVRRVSSHPGDGVEMEFSIYDDAGELLGMLSQVQLRRARSLDWFYEVAWQPVPALPASRSVDQDLAQAFWRELNGLCGQYLQRALTRLKEEREPAADRHQALLRHLQATSSEAESTDDPGAVAERLRTDYPDYESELDLVTRVGGDLEAILRGDKDPLESLFGDQAAEKLYRDSVSAKALNALVAREVGDAVVLNDSLHILEVGGGSGGTTRELLPQLVGQVVQYDFTDISPLFVKRAAKEFAAYPFVNSKVLDIEQPGESQGFAAEQYDLILAANVIHATRSLAESLQHLYRLLKPGGKLLLVEGTEPQPWLDLTFGLTEGWWRFADRDLRPNHPLLSAERWQNILADIGFEEVRVLPEQQLRSALAGQAVITAVRNGAAKSVQPCWIILGDEGETLRRLRSHLAARGHEGRLLDAEAEDAYGLEQVIRQESQLRGIIRLCESETVSDSFVRLEQVCGTGLAVMQALQRSGRSVPIWFVTRGAFPIHQEGGSTAQSPLWAMARTFRQECPDFRCQCLDLDPADMTAVEWLTEFDVQDQETEIAYRDGVRYVARLRHAQPASGPTATPVQLQIRNPGSFDGLELIPFASPQPQRGEVVIQIEAAGLNFLDVLDALGVLPLKRSWIGGECAGRIVQVGEGVSDFAAGDEVIALAPGSFASHVTVNAALVARKPRHLSFAEAATLPVAFLTAWRSFELAEVKAGDVVLIHAASGGVGVAAVQLAQRAGAEVIASVGREEKRQKLREYGVKHFISSRQTGWVETVREMTGGRGADVVLNSLKGEFIPESLAALAEGGRFIEIGKTDIWNSERVARVRSDVFYAIYDLAHEVLTEPEAAGQKLRALCRRVEQDHVTESLAPLPHRCFPLAEASDAFRWMANASHFGKIILQPNSQAATHRWQIRDDVRYLITGASGGLGMWMCEWLIEQGARHLVLWSRREPDAEIRRQLQKFAAAGVEIVSRVVDVSRFEEVQRGLEALDQTTPLRGILHCAGVLDDALLPEQDWSRFQKVFGPKAVGAWNLHRLTQDRKLDWFVMFSSAASLMGPAGQMNHVAANAFLDGLAHQRRNEGRPALSINWGVWSEIGAAARKGREQEMMRKGIQFISPKEAAQAMSEIQRFDVPQLGVFPMNWQAYVEQFPNGQVPRFLAELVSAAPVDRKGTIDSGWQERLRCEPARSRRRLLTTLVHDETCLVLGRRQSIEPELPLRDIGLDSLLALELCNRVGTQLGMKLSPTILFDYPTITALVGHLLEAGPFSMPTKPAPPVSPTVSSSMSVSSSAVPAVIETISLSELAEQLTAELSSGNRRES